MRKWRRLGGYSQHAPFMQGTLRFMRMLQGVSVMGLVIIHMTCSTFCILALKLCALDRHKFGDHIYVGHMLTSP